MNSKILSPTHHIFPFLLLIALFLLETGCDRLFPAKEESVPSIDKVADTDFALTDRLKDISADKERLLDALENNPCGHLTLSGSTRFFNVTGRLTSRVLPGSEIRMFITPNVSLNHSLFVVQNCPPFWRSGVDDDGNFNLTGSPPGKYVLYLPIESFPKGSQGFPIPEEFEKDGYRLVIVFQGGDPKNSLGVFRIERMDSNRSS